MKNLAAVGMYLMFYLSFFVIYMCSSCLSLLVWIGKDTGNVTDSAAVWIMGIFFLDSLIWVMFLKATA